VGKKLHGTQLGIAAFDELPHQPLQKTIDQPFCPSLSEQITAKADLLDATACHTTSNPQNCRLSVITCVPKTWAHVIVEIA
jgi:hypothetical protein